MDVNLNNERITKWVDILFSDLPQTGRVREQKEELQIHLIDRIKDYMSNGIAFDQAFESAKNDLGDVEELKADFRPAGNSAATAGHDDDWDEDWDDDDDDERGGAWWKITALTPFVFVIGGFLFNWWHWAWAIIPVTAILSTPGISRGHRIIALTPFIFVLSGFFFGFWAWGWIIIPVAGILFYDK